MRRWMAIMLLALVLLPIPALAQGEVQLEVDPGDTELLVTGWLGEQNAFVANLRLTARGGDTAFIFLPSDLVREDGEEVGRQQVVLVGDPILTAEKPKDLQVKVNGVEMPGTYHGRVEILLEGQARSEARALPLTLVARTRPALTALPDTGKVSLRLVRCERSFDCWFAGILLPDSAFLDTWRLEFDNATLVPVTVLDAEAILRGEHTNYQLTDAEFTLPKGPQTLPANEIVSLDLQLSRRAIPPDHYTGVIYLTLEGQDARMTVPVDLSVRSGPFWPLLFLLLGVVLGRLFKYMQERGGSQADAQKEVNRIKALLMKADPEDAALLQPQVEEVEELVPREKQETVIALLKAIEARIKVLGELRKMQEEDLKGKEQDPDAKKALALIAKARRLLRDGEDVKDLLVELGEILAQLRSSLMSGGAPDADIDRAVTRAEEALGAADGAMAGGKAAKEKRTWGQRLQDWLILLSGQSELLRVQATLWLVRPMLYLALLAGLLAVGISSLYVTNGTTFGANPLSDYLGIVLWGLSADVTGRSLTNLRGPNPE